MNNSIFNPTNRPPNSKSQVEQLLEDASLGLIGTDWLRPPTLQPITLSQTQGWTARLYRATEVNADTHSAYRSALANVYATLDPEQDARFLYHVEGTAHGVQLHFGVIAANSQIDIHEADKTLITALEGHLPGLCLQPLDATDNRAVVQQLLSSPYKGVALGVPTAQEESPDEDEDFQGIERLVRALLVGGGGDSWRMAVISRPMHRDEIEALLNQALESATTIAKLVRKSVQYSDNTSAQHGISTSDSHATGSNSSDSVQQSKNEGGTKTDTKSNSSGSSSSSSSSSNSTAVTNGTSESYTINIGHSDNKTKSETLSVNHTSGDGRSVTQDLVNKRMELLLEHFDKALVPRIRKGHTKGLFLTAVYLAADTPSAYKRLERTYCATFQGGESSLSPVRVITLSAESNLAPDLPTMQYGGDAKALTHSMHHIGQLTGSLLTSDELALIASLPRKEVPGLIRREAVEFAQTLPRNKYDQAGELTIGRLIDHGRIHQQLNVPLQIKDLNKHIFITGVTGAGKTTTCFHLLIESKLPFLVIEPAKTEYRALHHWQPNIVYYRPLADRWRSFRFNPLALTHAGQKLPSHIEFMASCLAAVFPMEASMPYMVKEAITRAYAAAGWDVSESEFLSGQDPFNPIHHAWPTLSDMIKQLDQVIKSANIGKEFEEKYRGSLVSRLTDLTRGPLGEILDVKQSVDFDKLLDHKVVLELEEIKSPEGKSLIMAFLLGSLAEAVKARYQKDPNFKHLTLVEEAHRLLSQPAPGADDSRRLAVESFADLLSEVRKYGEGLIIADQIPAKLIPDVIKNTHTKIVHRLFALDDRRSMGEAMMMTDAQQNHLPKLQTGQAVVFCGGWHSSALAAIYNTHVNTDDTVITEPQLDDVAVNTLWDARHRYYPTLAQLNLFSSAQQKQFAQFTKDARGALNALLNINPKRVSGQSPRAEGSKTDVYQMRLATFVKTWEVLNQQAQDAYTAWRSINAPQINAQCLAVAWLAVLVDSNPLPRTDLSTILPIKAELSQYYAQHIDAILSQLQAKQPIKESGGVRPILNALNDYERFQ